MAKNFFKVILKVIELIGLISVLIFLIESIFDMEIE